MIFIVSGVAGSGKTTVGALVSEKLGLPFYDADDYHPKENIEKMASGLPLNDQDRVTWLRRLSLQIIEWEGNGGAILACSALKEFYRQILVPISPDQITWIILHGPKELIAERMEKRKDHFFNSNLLDSQFEIFEIPNYGWHFNIEDTSENIVERVVEKWRIRQAK